jgi:hypothetical protein
VSIEDAADGAPDMGAWAPDIEDGAPDGDFGDVVIASTSN